jgi:peptidoglycan hydrolase-like protein with peptidoglycan-binding domain
VHIAEIIPAILFVLSSGLLFNKRFRENGVLLFFAGSIALVASYFLFDEIANRLIRNKLEAHQQRTESVVKAPQPPAVQAPPIITAPTIESLKAQADKGDTIAMNALGAAYGKGEGVTKDTFTARSWFRRAANLGNDAAMNNLAYFYDMGWGGEQDTRMAVEWYAKAANLGNATAMWNLANMYEEDLPSLPRDSARSANYLLMALKKGENLARERTFTGLPTWSLATRAAVQSRLRQDGFYGGPINGRFDAQTYRALEAYANLR